MKKPLFLKLKKDLAKDGWNPKSVTALVIFGAICIVFVFFGYSGKHNKIGTGAAAQVNSALLSVSELRSESQRLEQMYAPMFGGNIQEAQRRFIQQQALENMISTELIAQGAVKAGIIIPDNEVREVVVKEIPAFQENGKFQRDRYLGVLDANHWSPGEFEDRIRKERETNRFRRALEEVSSPLEYEVKKDKEMRESSRSVDFVKIERSQVIEKTKISDTDLQKQLADPAFLKKVQEDFAKNKAQYGTEEEVRAQHILIKVNPKDSASEAKAKATIAQIQKRAEKEDFGKLAAEVSEDQGSKANKGDLGTFGHGKMVPEFDAAAFSQKVGVVGPPVKSNFGYHLIKVNEHKAAQEANFDKVKNQIAKKLIASDRYDEQMKKLQAALESGDHAGADAVIKEMGLTWQDSGFFDLSTDVAPKIGSASATELALDVNEKNPWPKKLARDAGAAYLVKWKADQHKALPETEKINETLARDRSYDLLTSWLENQKKTATIERNTDLLSGVQ